MVASILPFIGSISQFPLRFSTVTMTADRFNKIHAMISYCRFVSVFAPFLVIPDCTGTTARHYPRHTIIYPDQPEIGLILVQQTIAFFIRYAFRHYFIPLPITTTAPAACALACRLRSALQRLNFVK